MLYVCSSVFSACLVTFISCPLSLISPCRAGSVVLWLNWLGRVQKRRGRGLCFTASQERSRHWTVIMVLRCCQMLRKLTKPLLNVGETIFSCQIDKHHFHSVWILVFLRPNSRSMFGAVTQTFQPTVNYQEAQLRPASYMNFIETTLHSLSNTQFSP
jgi:hypothetical protein